MRGRRFDPRHLDVEAFAERDGELADVLPLAGLARLADALHAEAAPASTEPVAWQARGECRRPRGGAPQHWLHLRARTALPLTCQRCLQAVVVPLAVDCSYRFVPDEATAAEADIDAEEDLLPTTRSLDLPTLIEDELLMALPLVPRHDGACPEPLAVPAEAAALLADAAADEPARRHPFEALAVLKTPKAGH